jgi:hypothetical protein
MTVRAVIAAGHTVIIPCVCSHHALVASACHRRVPLSGIPAAKTIGRGELWLGETCPTLIAWAPHRLLEALEALQGKLGDRQLQWAGVTKLHEIFRGRLSEASSTSPRTITANYLCLQALLGSMNDGRSRS